METWLDDDGAVRGATDGSTENPPCSTLFPKPHIHLSLPAPHFCTRAKRFSGPLDLLSQLPDLQQNGPTQEGQLFAGREEVRLQTPPTAITPRRRRQ